MKTITDVKAVITVLAAVDVSSLSQSSAEDCCNKVPIMKVSTAFGIAIVRARGTNEPFHPNDTWKPHTP
eukprot:CAMPEP_0117587096 /NCGR_PEP_ID=MMETSP0784-20121206/69092_1 /TAXON_ID=39447 /ORGANISM="" /LENGTH=68 /DNA_ID=CAMNT_0005388279 /DNA_START=101 /DNA_END=303 /DNA_ORIENTATION=+